MALITPGHWPSTYWPSQYWQEDYWVEYGTYVPPPPAVPTPTGAFRKKKPTIKLDRQTLSAIKDYLEWKMAA